MARPQRRRLGEQIIERRAQEMARAGTALAEPPTDLEARGQATSVGGIQGLPGSPEPPGVLEGAGPPPPAPVEQPVAAPVQAHPAAGAEGLNPEFGNRLNALIAASGGRIWINSGYRSIEDQQRLWDANPNPKWVAPPGKSNHNHGIAADLGGDLELAHRLAPQFGLVFPMSHEAWHIEPVGLRQDPGTSPEAYTAPGIKEKPSIVETIQGDNGPVDVPVENMAKFAEMAAWNEIDFNEARHLGETQTVATPEGTPKVLEGEGPEPPAPEPAEDATAAAVQGGETGEGGDAESWIREAMRITGVDESWYPGLKARMMQESGGRNIPQGIVDVNTQKGTPAFGPMQVIEPTFRAHALPGYENWRDPLHNTVASIRYILSRYGHPSKLPKGGY